MLLYIYGTMLVLCFIECFNQPLWYNACFLFDKMLEPIIFYFSNLSNVILLYLCSLNMFRFCKTNGIVCSECDFICKF